LCKAVVRRMMHLGYLMIKRLAASATGCPEELARDLVIGRLCAAIA
jgi:hypothetical protein